MTKFNTPKSSQQGSPAQGLSPGIKTPKSQFEGSPTLPKAKAHLTNLKLSTFQENSLFSPFSQTEPSTSRSLSGTTNFETVESNRNSSNYNQSLISEVALGLRNSSSENFRPSQWKGNHDKLRKTQIIQRSQNEVQSRQKSLDTVGKKVVNGDGTRPKLIKVVSTQRPQIDPAKLLTRQLPAVKSGVQTPTKNFMLPTPKVHPLTTRAGYFKKEHEVMSQADSANNTPRRPEGENPSLFRGLSRTFSAQNNDIVVTSHDNLDGKSPSEGSPCGKSDQEPQKAFLLPRKRESNIMTKELEAKYGIQMNANNDDDSSSLMSADDDSFEVDESNKPVKEELKFSPLENVKSALFDHVGETKTESKIKDFLIKRHEVKSARGSRRVNSMAPGSENKEGVLKEKRIKTMIGNEDYWGNRNLQTEEAKKKEDLFVGGNSDYFQLNTEHNKYTDYMNLCQDDIASLQTKAKKEKKVWEDKLPEDEYKPMVVWFGTGGRIIQPKYMKSMGSMCYTEFWPKHLSMKIQKMVVKEGDCLKLTNTERNYETVYRPVKWNADDGVKKRVDKTTQAMKGGHERKIGMEKEKNKMRDHNRLKKK